MTNVDRIFAEARALSDDEREELVDRLVGLRSARDPDVDAAWVAEAHRRRAEWKAGRVELLSAKEALEQMFPKS
jgi:hypothetical protein